MITQFDDYAIHQTPEPVSRPATGDRNFYDRWFFAGHDADGRFMFEAAIGLYPNRRVLDAHFSVVVDGVQHCFHGSRRAPAERAEISIGPFALLIEEPMQVLRLCLADGASGLACDLRFRARSAPIEEPPSRLYDEQRLVMHTTRFIQFGSWEGEFSIDGRKSEVAGAFGVRDRSWGIRPCGEPEAGAPSRVQNAPRVYWAWCPISFDALCLYFNTFEDPAGRATQLGAGTVPAYPPGTRAPATADPGQRESREAALRVRWRPGTRHPHGGSLRLIEPDGARLEVELEPLATLLTRGLGYHHPQWGHGFWRGELALGQERFRPDTQAPLSPENVHVHQLVRATVHSPSGVRRGTGLLETMCFGPHAPSGFTGFLDAAR